MCMSESLKVVHAHFEALNWGHVADGMKLMDDAAIWANVATGQFFHGPQGYGRFWSGWRLAFPNFWLEIQRLHTGENWASLNILSVEPTRVFSFCPPSNYNRPGGKLPSTSVRLMRYATAVSRLSTSTPTPLLWHASLVCCPARRRSPIVYS